MEAGNKYLYPLFKMMIGVICLILSAEYVYAFCVYQAASFGIMYIGDAITWLLAGGILFTEGLQGYLRALVDQQEQVPLTVDHRS
jgi:hypothetical protein